MENTKSRLATYRAMAEKFKSSSAGIAPGKEWRYWKRNIWETQNNARGPEGQIYSDSVHQYGTSMGDAHKIVRLNHTGWFTNTHCYETIIGAVVKLRCPKGTMYIPVTYCSDSDGVSHYVKDYFLAPKGASEEEHEEASKDAARSADEYARIQADKEQEFYEQEEQEEAW